MKVILVEIVDETQNRKKQEVTDLLGCSMRKNTLKERTLKPTLANIYVQYMSELTKFSMERGEDQLAMKRTEEQK